MILVTLFKMLFYKFNKKTNHNMIKYFALIIVLFTHSAQSNSLEGIWITKDDVTGREKSEVLLYKDNGKLHGKIINLLLPEDKGKLCTKCKGEYKNKPIEGMIILNDLILEDGIWEDGTIIDPKSGKIYDCYLSLEKQNTLKVRGYLGFSLLGRTQIWKRKN